MDFSLTEEQSMIREAAQSFLADRCDSESVRAAMAKPGGFDPEIWASIGQELGWCGLPVAEEHGGLGLGAVELMLVQEQAGYRLLCAPFFSTVCLGATLLSECADAAAQAELLPALAAGELMISAPLNSSAAAWLESSVTATAHGDEWALSGELSRVPDGGSAQRLLVTARVGDELGLFHLAVSQPGVESQILESWDAGRRFAKVSLNGAIATRCEGENLPASLRKAAALVRLYIAAEQLGGAQRCLDLTVDYVQERKQFGRAVGSFQAVKHRCAEMMVRIEGVRSAIYGAAALAASAPDLLALDMETASARGLATEALQYCAGEAIQLHGGVGFTWEYDPQLYFKRAQASAHWLGSPAALRQQIAANLLDDEVMV